MQPDESRKKTSRRLQWRLLLLIVVLSILTLFLLTQRVTAPPLATQTPSYTVLADTLTLIDPIWQTATAFHIERLPEIMTITQEALTATRTPPTLEVGPIVATDVIASATALAATLSSAETATTEPASG